MAATAIVLLSLCLGVLARAVAATQSSTHTCCDKRCGELPNAGTTTSTHGGRGGTGGAIRVWTGDPSFVRTHCRDGCAASATRGMSVAACNTHCAAAARLLNPVPLTRASEDPSVGSADGSAAHQNACEALCLVLAAAPPSHSSAPAGTAVASCVSECALDLERYVDAARRSCEYGCTSHSSCACKPGTFNTGTLCQQCRPGHYCPGTVVAGASGWHATCPHKAFKFCIWDTTGGGTCLTSAGAPPAAGTACDGKATKVTCEATADTASGTCMCKWAAQTPAPCVWSTQCYWDAATARCLRSNGAATSAPDVCHNLLQSQCATTRDTTTASGGGCRTSVGGVPPDARHPCFMGGVAADGSGNDFAGAAHLDEFDCLARVDSVTLAECRSSADGAARGTPCDSSADGAAASAVPAPLSVTTKNICEATTDTRTAGHAGADAIALPCPAGRYGASAALQFDDCDGECPRGYYCPEGSLAPKAHPCPAGRYGQRKGLGDEACDGDCFAGYYCDPGSVSPTQAPCPAGRFSSEPGLSSEAGCAECAPGHYCEEGATEMQLCPSGRYGASRGLTNPLCDGPCEDGFACGEGSTSPRQQPCTASAHATNSVDGAAGATAYQCTVAMDDAMTAV